MTEKLIIGWAINSVCLLHFFFKFKGGKLNKIIALILLTIPYLGALAYLIFFVWDVPPPQPILLRQNRMNHYGRTEFGEVSDDITERREIKYPTFKTKPETIPNPAKKMTTAARAALILICLVIITYGISSIYQGSWSYSAWHGGGLIFGPLAIVIGCLMIYLIIYKWNKMR
jgi:hypothetical protein